MEGKQLGKSDPPSDYYVPMSDTDTDTDPETDTDEQRIVSQNQQIFDAEQQIIESAPQIIVETTEEFLQTFTLSNFSDKTKIVGYKNIANSVEPIGSRSNFGTIYDMGGGNVLKVMKMCRAKADMAGDPPIIQELCNTAKENSIILRIPNTQTNKLTVLLPQYLSEAIAGTLLRKMSAYTPSFMKIKDFQYDPIDPYTMYMVQEKLEPLTTKVIKGIDDFLVMIFQLCHALSVAQRTSRFTHYDLHKGNVMLRRYTKKQKYSYALGNGLYLHLEKDWEAVIIDYGFIRMETRDSVIWPSQIFNGVVRDIVDHSYNPYYDIFLLLRDFGSIFNKYSEYTDLMKMFLKTNDDALTDNVVNKWLTRGGNKRPIPERFSIPWTDPATKKKFTGACNATEMTSRLAKYLSNRNNIEYSAILKEGHKVYPTPMDIMNHNTLQYNLFSRPGEPDLEIDNGITIRTLDLEIVPVPRDPLFSSRGVRTKQLVHVIEINTNTVLKNGFRFGIDCCRMNVHDFMQDVHIDGGVAINGGLFAGKEFLPVGRFETGDFFSDVPIPDEHIPYYGIVAIDHDNRLVISGMDDATDYPTVLSTAPKLVENGVISNIDLVKQLPDLRDATEIKDRSAIGILPDNRVMMVCVEGGTDYTAGMDLQQLSHLMFELGCDNAVGLSGGSNSSMGFKVVGQNIINLVGKSRTRTHLVGNIISCTKKV